MLSSQLKSSHEHIHLNIIEACDGIECILALYLAQQKKMRVDAIISDETMPFISGSFSSKIIAELVSNACLKDTKMFISTALSHTNISNNFSKIVRRIYSKPMDKTVMQDILKEIDK